ncbi:hypothetical protein CDV31_013450 [Fusarium ambrosium]|uniref:Uncharacterized protein n=1 Tax=Fusarium ambrosium TaxID=131363 RepID=A0A428T361_9HYPO|nr:hypothetical protein CDV31_013450 [Fusarium ambrosium]
MGPRVRGLRRRGSTLSRESRRSQRQKTASTEADTDINTDVPSSVEAPNEIPDDGMTDDLESNDAADSDADADADAIDENAHDSDFDLRDAEHERQESPSSTSRAPETMIPDRRPGWWPSRYAPQNPDDRNCVSGMSSVLKKWAELKRDPEELWKEDDPPGVMIEAIRKHTSKHVVTQRVFMRAKKMIRELYPQAPLVTPRERLGRATGNHNPDGIAPAERLESPGPGPGPGPGSKADGVSGLTQGPSHGSGSESENLAINPSEVLLGALADELSIVEVDSNATFALPHTDSLEHTTSRLRTNMMLKSIDLQRCVTVLHRDADWHTFDPGFPFHGSSGQEASVLTEGQAPPSIFLPPLVVTENNAAVGHFQAFLESRKRMQDGVKELERTVSTRKDHILQLDLERETLRKELRQEEDALQELSKELAGVDSTDTTDREAKSSGAQPIRSSSSVIPTLTIIKNTFLTHHSIISQC